MKPSSDTVAMPPQATEPGPETAAVAVLFCGAGSYMVVGHQSGSAVLTPGTVAVLVIVWPFGTPGSTRTVRTKMKVVSEAGLAGVSSVAMQALTVPVPPGAGVDTETSPPDGLALVHETNVVFSGTAMRNATFFASNGPAFSSRIVMSKVLPGCTVCGEALALTDTSATGPMTAAAGWSWPSVRVSTRSVNNSAVRTRPSQRRGVEEACGAGIRRLARAANVSLSSRESQWGAGGGDLRALGALA